MVSLVNFISIKSLLTSYHDFMKDSSGAVIHLVKLINTADAIVTQY